MTTVTHGPVCRFEGVRTVTSSTAVRRRRGEDALTHQHPTRGRGGSERGRESDAAVITRSWDDPHAFAEIFDRHHEDIYRFAWTRAGADRADDLAAEVFRIAFEKRHDYDPDYPSAKPWLFGIASRLAKQTHRDTAKRDDARTRMNDRDRRPHSAEPARHLEERPGTSPAGRAVQQLPERDREPLLLFAWGDLTYEEIARTLGIPVGTVRSRIHRARQQLREHLVETAPETTARRTGDGDG